MVMQSQKRQALIWSVSLVGIAVSGFVVLFACQPFALSKPRQPLSVRLDTSGPYVILATAAADRDYRQAIQNAQALHPHATRLKLPLDNMEPLLESLRTIQPRYALIFIKPDELDVNFAWKWLALTTRIDDDPLVDVSTGFITGANSDEVASFVERIAKAVRGESSLPGKLIDNFGPNPQAPQNHFQQQAGCFMIPVYQERTALASISHGAGGFTDRRLDALQGAGLIHLGGHGYPDGVVDGVQSLQAKELKLSPCVVFNGACYTGVTGRWFNQWTAQGKVESKTVSAEKCFCLNLLGNSTIAYLAALHHDHGIPVYQEMEYLAYTGRSLGDVMRHTHNGVILGNGGRMPEFEPFVDQMPSPKWTPSDVMLKGTAARILFGDPALIVSEAFTKPPFEITTTRSGSDQLQIRAVLSNSELKSEFTDTFHADLASNKQLFNDRALIVVDLPEDWKNIGTVEVTEARAAGQEIPHRLLGYALETEGNRRRLYVQVDLPTTGYMQSPFRQKGATVVLTVGR
ncbi:hypothetical protein Pan153_22330 [Gimesia panareensis]|uniref:Gingipain domain-containing protein n=1 Tax=Gimesia panareensis TaxID=2527978 RepID=A0A518FMN4_9PLAN|nr:hypothetical protein [Gimesia panareensis]QDV17580.1 hypothetical protein Pan153_22330 [Gimesia panareensis]